MQVTLGVRRRPWRPIANRAVPGLESRCRLNFAVWLRVILDRVAPVEA